jgi:hypothetical protein
MTKPDDYRDYGYSSTCSGRSRVCLSVEVDGRKTEPRPCKSQYDHWPRQPTCFLLFII